MVIGFGRKAQKKLTKRIDLFGVVGVGFTRWRGKCQHERLPVGRGKCLGEGFRTFAREQLPDRLFSPLETRSLIVWLSRNRVWFGE